MFCRIGIVVPLYSHATKSTPITLPTQTPKNHSTHLFGQNLTIPYPNSPSKSTPKTTTKQTNSTPFLHYPIKLPYPTQTLINPTQINKISPKTPHSHNIPIKIVPNHKKQNKPQQNSTQTPNNTKYT